MLDIYTFLVHKADEPDTGYWAECLELPGCVAQGETLEELKRNIREAVPALPSTIYAVTDDATYGLPWTAFEGVSNPPGKEA